MNFKFKKSHLTPKILVLIVLSLCLTVTTFDSTRAEPFLGIQYSSSPQMKTLLKDQKLDLKVFNHLQKSEYKGFRAAQETQLKEWEAHESKERHKFFGEHETGTERRTYVQDFMKRREDLLRQISEDKAKKIVEQNAKLKTFRDGQEEKIKQLSEKLKEEREEKAKKLLDKSKT
ncbi:MAG: hypothetical protein ABIQ95_04345 [Bdellovibrionia bacterium]